MANPTKGSWKVLKKVARYLVGRKSVVWRYDWQKQAKRSYLAADSDWGGNWKDRRSTSGGCWMVGDHLIKSWSATQQAYALSSVEAEFYAMLEAVTRGKGLVTLAAELGFGGLSSVIRLGTDSSAAKSFVCRRGLGRMRHLDIRDLWLQKEIREGKVEVVKIPGTQNPADLMTKILKFSEVEERLRGMNLEVLPAQGGYR